MTVNYEEVDEKRWQLGEWLVDTYSLCVIPFYSSDEKDQKKAGKIPCIEWEEWVSTKISDLEKWKKEDSARNLGVRLGGQFGVVAIKVTGQEGKSLLKKLNGGTLPETVAFIIPDNGQCYLFRVRAKDKGNTFRKYIEHGADKNGECVLLGDGEFILLPYSTLPNDKACAFVTRQSFDNIKLAYIPAWMKKLMLEQPTTNDEQKADEEKTPHQENRIVRDPFKVIFHHCPRLSELYNTQKTKGLDKITWQNVTKLLAQITGFEYLATNFSELSAKHDERSQESINLLLSEAHNDKTIRCPTLGCGEEEFEKCFAKKYRHIDKRQYDKFGNCINSPAPKIRSALNKHGFYPEETGIIYDSMGNFQKIEHNRFAKYFLEHHDIRFQKGTGPKSDMYYQYSDDNYWIPTSEHKVKQLLINFLNKHEPNNWNIGARNQILEVLQLQAEAPSENAANYINLKNGLLNLKTFKIAPHNKEIFSTKQLPVAYDPDKEAPPCEGFLDYLAYIFGKDKRLPKIVQEIMGYSLCNNTQAEKMFFFIGPSRTGKSTLGKIIMALAGGPKYVSSLSLGEFNEQFALSELVGKNLNISFESKSLAVKDIEKIKAIVTGDMTKVEKKYADVFFHMHTTKLIFCLNTWPDVYDATNAFIERLLPIPFKHKFYTEKQKDEQMKERDPNFFDRIIKNELDGIFAFAIEGLKRLVRNNYRFTESKVVKNMLSQYKQEINPLLQFVKNCVISVENEATWGEERVHHDIMFYANKLWEEEQGNSSTSKDSVKEQKRKFTMNFKNTLDSESILYKDQSSTGATYYLGIALTEEMKETLRHSHNDNIRNIIKKFTRCGV
jgi:putative DNA primase/helicase